MTLADQTLREMFLALDVESQRAVRDILGWTEIAAREVNLEAIVLGELAENELRKDFTPSERVAIADEL